MTVCYWLSPATQTHANEVRVVADRDMGDELTDYNNVSVVIYSKPHDSSDTNNTNLDRLAGTFGNWPN